MDVVFHFLQYERMARKSVAIQFQIYLSLMFLQSYDYFFRMAKEKARNIERMKERKIKNYRPTMKKYGSYEGKY